MKGQGHPVQAVLYWRQSALKPNRNALWMEVSCLYCRILREQKKSAAADVRQTGRLEGGSPMSAPAQLVANGTALAGLVEQSHLHDTARPLKENPSS
jgi:hypothetical protein